MRLRVTYSDGETVEANAGPRAQVALERRFDISLEDANRIEHVYYLGWAALHFGGREADKDFDDFLGRIEDAEIVKSEPADARPTKRARPATASPA